MAAHEPDALRMHSAEDRSHRSIYLRFVALSLIALVAVAAMAVWASKNRALEHEMLEAHLAIEHVAFELVASSRSDGSVVDARQATLTADLTRDLRLAHMSEAIVVDETGTIVYALDPALVGRPSPGCVTDHDLHVDGGTVVHPVDAADVGLPSLPTGTLMASVTTYHSSGGEPLLLAAFGPESEFVEGWTRELAELAPPAIAGLVLLQLINFPLAWSLSKQTRASAEERTRLLSHALLSGDRERRRIAQDLHDTVIPDLAGVSYAIESASQGVNEPSEALLRRARGVLTRDLAYMRTLLASLIPTPVEHEPLSAAVEALVPALSEAGITTHVDLDHRLDDTGLVSPSARLVAYRVMREGLRNVARHARATTALVEAAVADDVVTVRVQDDGVGLPAAPSSSADGHVGLQLLMDETAELGGRLTVSPAPGSGTLLEAVFPAR